MEPHFISTDALAQLVGKLPEGEVFAIVAGSGSSDFQRLPDDFAGEVALHCPRPLSSPRSVLFPMREVVARYPNGDDVPEEGPPITLLGIRACDLRAVQALDKVLLDGEFRDPFYASRRDRTLLVSVDCAEAAEQCFCTAVDGCPYPTAEEAGLFDINLSPVADGFVIDIGSEKGKEVAVLAQDLLADATAEQLAEREANRQRTEEAVRAQNEPYRTNAPMAEVVQGAEESELVREAATRCSECGACTLVCPTCHCFLLYDQLAPEGQGERVRAMDSCLFASYARMAGIGGMKPTPRPDLSNRFLNRLLHKFVWLPQTEGLLGCVGCGRCIEADMGGLDIRQFVQQLEG